MKSSYFFFKFTATFLLLFLLIAFFKLEKVNDTFLDWTLPYEQSSRWPLSAEIEMLFILRTVFLRFCISLYISCFYYSVW